MDEFDRASELEQYQRELALDKVRAKKKSFYTGHCRYCNETITQGSFCSAECREGQELEDKFKHITGHR